MNNLMSGIAVETMAFGSSASVVALLTSTSWYAMEQEELLEFGSQSLEELST